MNTEKSNTEMSARDFDELLSAYLDGEVTPEERAAVEQRLEQSPALRETLDELSEVGDLIRHLPRAKPPVDLPQRVLSAISPKPQVAARSEAVPHRHGLWRRLRGWPLALAGTVAAAGVTIAVVLQNGKPAERSDLARREPLPELKSVSMPVEVDFARDKMELSDLSAATPVAGSVATDSLASLVEHLQRKPQQGEVLRTVVSNAGQTQVLQYTVVDTNEMPGTLKTIFANNNLDIVVTETPAPPARTLAQNGQNRLCFYVEGTPEQIGRTLKEIETLPTVAFVDDYGILAETPEDSVKLDGVVGDQPGVSDRYSITPNPTAPTNAPAAPAPSAALGAPRVAGSAEGGETPEALARPLAVKAPSAQPIENEKRIADQPPPAPAARGMLEGVSQKSTSARPDQSAPTNLGVGLKAKADAEVAAAANPNPKSLPAPADANVAAGQTEGAPALAKDEPNYQFRFQRGVTTQLDEQTLEQLLVERPMMNNALQNNALQSNGIESKGAQRLDLRTEGLQNNAVTNNGLQLTPTYARGRQPTRRAGGYGTANDDGAVNNENRRSKLAEQKLKEAADLQEAELSKKMQPAAESENVSGKAVEPGPVPTANYYLFTNQQAQPRSRAIIILQSTAAPEPASVSPASPNQK